MQPIVFRDNSAGYVRIRSDLRVLRLRMTRYVLIVVIVLAGSLAAAFGISDLGTKGGLRTDTAARVLDASGTPIPGLYAAGNTMAAPSGTAYPAGGTPIGTTERR